MAADGAWPLVKADGLDPDGDWSEEQRTRMSPVSRRMGPTVRVCRTVEELLPEDTQRPRSRRGSDGPDGLAS